MKSALKLEKSWLEGLHRECLPAVNSYPNEIRDAIFYSAKKVGNPLFPFLTRWVLEPAGIAPHSIVPVAYSTHLLEASSYVIDRLVSDASPRSDKRLERLVSRYGDALCILCVDAMVTIAFRILTDLPEEEFHAVSDLLMERFGPEGVLGNKVRNQVNWKGDMFAVCLESSALVARFEPRAERALMAYAKSASALYRELEDLLGEPPGREVLIGRGACARPLKVRERKKAVELTGELVDETEALGAAYPEFFALSEGIGEVFGSLRRSLS